MSLLALFCDVDDFSNAFEQYLDQHKLGQVRAKSGPRPVLSLSEVMTIIIHFHQSNYRHFKAYYNEHVMVHLRSEFPISVLGFAPTWGICGKGAGALFEDDDKQDAGEGQGRADGGG